MITINKKIHIIHISIFFFLSHMNYVKIYKMLYVRYVNYILIGAMKISFENCYKI